MSKAIVPPAIMTWGRDESGSVALIGAFSLVLLLTCGGLAVDYERAVSVRGILQQAADSAVLAAAQDPYYTDAQVNALAQVYVASNSKSRLGASTLATTITRDGGSYVNVKITASVPTTLMKIAGFTTVAVTVEAKAGAELGDSEIYAAIDMSESLDIAADPASRAALEALTAPYMPAGSHDPQGCAFACHQRDGWEPAGKTIYQMAKTAGIALREDVLYKAFGAFVDGFMNSSDPAVAANHKRMSVIGFSDAAKMLLSPTNDAAAIKLAPASFPDPSQINSRFEVALPQIQSMMGPQGSGTPSSPRKTLLLITDGLRWVRKMANTPLADMAANGPINTGLCDSIKNSGITLAVIEVQFVDATGEYNFDQQVAAVFPGVSPALQACASPGYYFQATDSDAKTLAATFSTAALSLRTKLALVK